MNDNGRLIAIAVLAVTAVLLLCTVMILDRMPGSPALANSPDRPPNSDYILLTGGTIRGDEALFVIDIAARKVGVYGANINNGRIDIISRYDLSSLPGGK